MVVAFSVQTNPLFFLSNFLSSNCASVIYCVFFGEECLCVSQLEWRLFILLVMKEGPPGASVMGWEASDSL